MALPILNYMGLTVIYVVFSVMLINHGILQNFNMSDSIPKVFQGCIYGLLLYSLWGYYVSLKASENKCNKKDHVKSIMAGFTTALCAIIAYLVCYFVEPLQSPFIELFGNSYGNSIAEIFFISLNTIVIIIRNYFNTAKSVCKIDPSTLLTKFKELDEYLNTTPCKKGSSDPKCAPT